MAELASSIITVSVYVLGAFLILATSGLVAFLIYLRYGKNKPQVDVMKQMFEEMVDEAVTNKPGNMVVLERVPFPALATFKTDDGSVSQQALGEYSAAIRGIRGNGVRLGPIIGHATFDLLASVQDMMLEFDEKTKNTDTKGMTEAEFEAYKAAKEAVDSRRDEYDAILKAAGTRLHFFVYEVRRPGRLFFQTRRERRGIFAFDDQAFGLGSMDGIVTLAGEGTERLAIYFQILSGYPERLDIIRTHITSYSRIYAMSMFESNIVEFIKKAVGGDSDFYKTRIISEASRPTPQPSTNFIPYAVPGAPSGPGGGR